MTDTPTLQLPVVPRDVRQTAQFRAVTDFYGALFAPGTGLVYATREIHPAPDGSVYVIGATFATDLESGSGFNSYRIDPAQQRVTQVRGGGQHMAISKDGTRAAIFADNAVEIIDLADHSSIAQLAVAGIVEQMAWSSAGELGLLIAGAGADVSGAEGGFAMRVEQSGPIWLPDLDTGAAEDVWRRLWVWDGKSAALTPVTAPPLNVWEFDWSGTNALMAVCSDHHGEASWYTASLRTINRASGTATVRHTPDDQFAKPKVSPDGSATAFIEAVCSDRGIVCGTLRLFRDGSVRTLATDGVEVTDLHWQSDQRLAFAGLRGLETVIGIYDLAVDASNVVWASFDRTCGDFHPAIAATGDHVYATVEGYAHAPELLRIDDQGTESLWSFAAPGEAPVKGVIEAVRWNAPDGLEIEGLLIRPDAVATGLPLLVDIHGGPIWAYRNRWVARYRSAGPLVAKGFAVLLVNPRGSAGRGQDFARRVVGDMGGADTYDFLSGFDHLAKLGIIDPDRIVLTGSSYGGFMSSWLITQDSRFAAAVPISPVINWYSQHFTSQIPSFDEMFLDGSPYTPGERYFERSPLFHARKVRTPALILTGARDKNTPPTQALEFHNALLLADSPSILCTYPEDGHSLRAYPAYLDSAARVMIWAEHFAGQR